MKVFFTSVDHSSYLFDLDEPKCRYSQSSSSLQPSIMHSSAIIITLLGCGLAIALARPQQAVQYSIPVLSRVHQSDDHGQFSSQYQSADGATVQETGFLKPTNDKTDYVLAKQGSFSYTSPEGVPVQVVYTADEYGFHPTGNVLPVGPAAVQPTF
ncbi:hypothetical protein J6590_011124 [Homalodisca vitripennis]|nr:hypothetical protein J6590_011124 [Homalodisca vitripennis]